MHLWQFGVTSFLCGGRVDFRIAKVLEGHFAHHHITNAAQPSCLEWEGTDAGLVLGSSSVHTGNFRDLGVEASVHAGGCHS